MENLLAHRLNRGWSQAELADRAGISQGLLSLIENGYAPKRGDTMARLAAALEVSADELTP